MTNGRRRALMLGLAAFVFGFNAEAKAAPFAFIIGDGGHVAVVDTATNTVEPQLIIFPKIGDDLPEAFDIVLSFDGTRAYVTLNGQDAVAVIDVASRTVVGSIPVGDRPNRLGITPDGNSLWVGLLGEGFGGSDQVVVVDLATQTVTAAVPGGGGSTFDFTPDGAKAYVGKDFSFGGFRSVDVVDMPALSLTKTISFGTISPGTVVAGLDGQSIYVGASRDIPVIRTDTDTIVDRIDVGSGCVPRPYDQLPDGSRLYASTNCGGVAAVDTATNDVITIVPVPGSPRQMRLTADGTLLYVANASGTMPVTIIDTATNTVAGTVPRWAKPGGQLVISTRGIATSNPCGNLVVDVGESCDDGNRLSDDGCSPVCRLYPTATATFTTSATPTQTPTPSNTPSATPTATVTSTSTSTPLPTASPSMTPSLTLTPTNTATRTPAPGSLVLTRVVLRASTSTTRNNGLVEVKGAVDGGDAVDDFIDDVDAGGLTVQVDGGANAPQLLAWTGAECAFRASALLCRGERQSASIRPSRGVPDSYQVKIRGTNRSFDPPLEAEPVTVILSTAPVDRIDAIGDVVPCAVRGGLSQKLVCLETH